ncbi:UTRA domain-containing protein [Glycomyces halotolerans]
MAAKTKPAEIADKLRTRIKSGEWSAGNKIPTEPELADEYGAGRGSVREALDRLTKEGLLESRRGSGRWVREFERFVWPLSSYESGRVTIPNADPWAVEVRKQGREPSETVRVSHEFAPADIAELLGVDEGTRVVVRHRIRYVDGRPVQLADSYFPESIAEGTPLLDPKPVQIAQGILAQIGHPQRHVTVRISWGIPTDEERAPFGDLPAGTPAAYITHIGYSEDETVLRVMRTVAPADRNEVTFELDMQQRA